MASTPAELGRLGERLAGRTLRRAGLRILARNWSTPGGEVDLVARDGKTIVFVEVKTRRATTPLPPEAAVDGVKQRRLVAAARAYLARHPFGHWHGVRFDVVAVVVGPGDTVTEIRHLPDAFGA